VKREAPPRVTSLAQRLREAEARAAHFQATGEDPMKHWEDQVRAAASESADEPEPPPRPTLAKATVWTLPTRAPGGKRLVKPNFTWSSAARKKLLEVNRPKSGPANVPIPEGIDGAALVNARRLEKLLVKFRDVFANDSSEVGRTGIIEYDIILKTGEVQPVTSGKSRPVPPKLQTEVAAEIQKMLAAGVIQESTSPWNSPIHVVRKPDGKIRFCIDYREVNDVTQADGGELPHGRADARTSGKLHVRDAGRVCGILAGSLNGRGKANHRFLFQRHAL